MSDGRLEEIDIGFFVVQKNMIVGKNCWKMEIIFAIFYDINLLFSASKHFSL